MTDAPDTVRITPHLLLQGYASGIFPMADSAVAEEIYFVDPQLRGIFPLDRFHVSRSLARAIRRDDYAITINAAFAEVLDACADREETWINPQIRELYSALAAMGHAHSLEVWRKDALIGGVYGVTLGAAFFGESMFSRATNGSKIALAYLVHRLRAGGFTLFDTQFKTRHLGTLGAIEIERATYHDLLAQALRRSGDFVGPQTPDAKSLVADLCS